MFSEFKSFVARSNVLKLAVAVITGNAFGSIVTALTDDIIMPLILGQIYGSSGCGFAGSIYRGGRSRNYRPSKCFGDGSMDRRQICRYSGIKRKILKFD